MDKAEDMLNEDVEGERSSTLTCSSQQGQVSEGQVGEVRGVSCDKIMVIDYDLESNNLLTPL